MDFSRADAAHLLRRAGFGSPSAEVDALMSLPSWSAVVDRVLDTSADPPDAVPPEVDDRVDEWYRPWAAGVQYWTDRMATTPTPIVEKMTLFWHGLFTSSANKLFPRLVIKQVHTYRALALGDLHDLVQAMAVDPAMLVYLDNQSNTASQPNENFAREVMEVFLLGAGSFDEGDVRSMARAWTGHGYDEASERYLWQPDRHDSGLKTLFGITRQWDGPAALTEVVRGSRQQDCARFIAEKVWRFLAGPAPSTTTLDALAFIFVSSGMQIHQLVRAVFLHPDFRAPATRTGLLRSPAEWIAASMKALGLPAATLHPEWYVERCGQRLYTPPNVGGWRANDGWITTSSTWGRAAFASSIRWNGSDAGIFAGYGSLAAWDAVQRGFDRFGIDDPSPVTRGALERYVSGEQVAGRGWSVPFGLIALLMLSPDFQMA